MLIPYNDLYDLVISKDDKEVERKKVDGFFNFQTQRYTFTDHENKVYSFKSIEFPIKEVDGLTFEIAERD